jgi:hypothetical protein
VRPGAAAMRAAHPACAGEPPGGASSGRRNHYRSWRAGDRPSGCANHSGPAVCYLTIMSLPPELIRFFGRLTTRSVLAPLSVPGGLIGTFALLMTPVAGPHHPLTWVLWIFFIIWMVGIGAAYIFWSIKNPDRLQTESYQLEQQRIRTIGDERHPGKVIEGTLTANTAAPMVAGNQ